MIPLSWRYKLAHIYLVEIFTVIIGLSSGMFGVTILTMTDAYRRIPSFQQAFRLVEPQWWGIAMVVLAVAMLSLLTHSRAAAAIPTSLLGIVWLLWVVPIALSPGFAPSAPIVYATLFALTIATGAACTVPREDRPDA